MKLVALVPEMETEAFISAAEPLLVSVMLWEALVAPAAAVKLRALWLRVTDGAVTGVLPAACEPPELQPDDRRVAAKAAAKVRRERRRCGIV